MWLQMFGADGFPAYVQDRIGIFLSCVPSVAVIWLRAARTILALPVLHEPILTTALADFSMSIETEVLTHNALIVNSMKLCWMDKTVYNFAKFKVLSPRSITEWLPFQNAVRIYFIHLNHFCTRGTVWLAVSCYQFLQNLAHFAESGRLASTG